MGQQWSKTYCVCGCDMCPPLIVLAVWLSRPVELVQCYLGLEPRARGLSMLPVNIQSAPGLAAVLQSSVHSRTNPMDDIHNPPSPFRDWTWELSRRVFAAVFILLNYSFLLIGAVWLRSGW